MVQLFFRVSEDGRWNQEFGLNLLKETDSLSDSTVIVFQGLLGLEKVCLNKYTKK